MAKKLSVSARIRALLEKGLSSAEIAKKVPGATPAYVAQVRWHDKQKSIKANKKTGKKASKRQDVVIDVPQLELPLQPAEPVLAGNGNGADDATSPYHYRAGGIDTWDFIAAKELNYNLGNVVKYVSRADYVANDVEDLKKAVAYLQREIAHRETPPF